jgi:hypothetical protein
VLLSHLFVCGGDGERVVALKWYMYAYVHSFIHSFIRSFTNALVCYVLVNCVRFQVLTAVKNIELGLLSRNAVWTCK